MKRRLTVSQAAKRLGVTLTHIYSLLHAGRIRGARKTQGKWQIPEDEIQQRLRNRQGRSR